jgi:hypothetical protein
MLAAQIPSHELLMAKEGTNLVLAMQHDSHDMPGESYDDVFPVFTPFNINNPSSVGPRTDSPFQWANLPTFSNNHRLFPMYKEGTNLLLAMQPISSDYYSAEVDLSLPRDLTNCSARHFAEMARMSVYSPTMLLRFPGYYNIKICITYSQDYNFATDLQFLSTFQSYGLPS